ncbi:MAG: HYR domain-containing protein [Phycisphaerae bacterium]|nr:HYR domain-containing protein [Phycisphaerae bacterium]
MIFRIPDRRIRGMFKGSSGMFCVLGVILVMSCLLPVAWAYNFTFFGGRLGRAGVDTGATGNHDFLASWNIPDSGTLTWYLDRNELPVGDCDGACFAALKARVQPELDKWALWLRVSFAEASSLNDAHIRYRFIDFSTVAGSADAYWDGHTGTTLEHVLIRIDPDGLAGWTTAAGRNDFAYLILHETGHALGLGDLYAADHGGGNVFEGEDFCDHGLPSGPLPDTRTKRDNVMQRRGQMVLDNDTIHGAEWLWGNSGSDAIVTGELDTRQAGLNANRAAKHHGLTQTPKTWTYRGSVASFISAPKVTLFFSGIQAARNMGPGAWTPTLFADRVEFDHAGPYEGNFKFQIDCDQRPERYGNARINTGTVVTNFTATPAGGGPQLFPFDQVFGADCGDVEVDYFPDTVAMVEIYSPTHGTEKVTVRGPTTVHVDLSSLGDADGNDLEEVTTEIVEMELTGDSTLFGPVIVRLRSAGSSPYQPSIGIIEEVSNDTPGVLDIPPFADTGTAISFFDVYFEIEALGQVYHNNAPKHQEAEIHEKPPRPGDKYESPEVIPLYDEDDIFTGLELRSASHTPDPIEVDYFPKTKATVEIFSPTHGTEDVTVTGPTTVHVDLSSLGDSDGNSLEEVTTEIVEMELTGDSDLFGPVIVRLRPETSLPHQRSMGQIEEVSNDTPGVLDIPPFADTGTAMSFFDVYFEIEVLGEIYHNNEPKLQATEIHEKPPREGDKYESPDVVQLYDENDILTGVELRSASHTPRPEEVDYFPATHATIEIDTPFGPETIALKGPTTVIVDLSSLEDGDGNGREEVQTEIVEMKLTGYSEVLNSPMTVRVRPDTAAPYQRSIGQIEEMSDNTPGVLDIPPFADSGTAMSFFDVYFQIEVAGEVYHNNQSKHLETEIHEKPPAEGDKYESPDVIPLYDEYNNPTGVTLKSASHTPNPRLEVDYFPETHATVEIYSPSHGTEDVTVTGPTTVHVDLGNLGDADDNGLEEVDTEIVEMVLTGDSELFGPVTVTVRPETSSPFRRSTGQIEEVSNDTDGVLDIPPFAETGTAMSFFDVYFEIEVMGQTYHNNEPKLQATEIHEKPPREGDKYESPDVVQLYDENDVITGVELRSASHTPRPKEIDYFPETQAKVEIYSPTHGTETVTVFGPTKVIVDLASLGDRDSDGLEEVDTELVEMDLHGESELFGPVTVRLRPDTASPGQRSIGQIEETSNNTPGVLDIVPFTETGTAMSFFDVHFEIEVFGELYHNNEPKHMETEIHEKPPREGDKYENPDTILLYNEDNIFTGVELRSASHTPSPKEVDYFPESVATIEIHGLWGPDTVTLIGPTTVVVDLGSLGDADENGQEEVPTEMTQLDLVGDSPIYGPITVRIRQATGTQPGDFDADGDVDLDDWAIFVPCVSGPNVTTAPAECMPEQFEATDLDDDNDVDVGDAAFFQVVFGGEIVYPSSPSIGIIEETANNTPGVLDIPPFAGTGTAFSFFDVFFEIDVAEMTLHNNQPKYMHTEITEKPPAGGETYESPEVIPLFDENNNYAGVDIGAVFHTPTPLEDITPPVITCPTDIAQPNDPGQCTAVVDPGTATATDDSGEPPVITSSRSDGLPLDHPYSVADTTITWVATDAASNTASCDQAITVLDGEAPVISDCPADMMVDNEPGMCSAAVHWSEPTALDNCGDATLTSTHTSGSTFTVDTTTVAYTATDMYTNTTTCNFEVIVADVEPPVIECPPDMEVGDDPGGGCWAMVDTEMASASDNCDMEPTITATRSDGFALWDPFPCGTTTVTWHATDSSGNPDQCVQTIMVQPISELRVNLELSPPMMVPPEQPLIRCITFELFDCGASMSVVVEQDVIFHGGFAMDVVVSVPPELAVCDCVTARDRLHTLRRTDEEVQIVGTQYVADFLGDPDFGGDWLIGGDLNEDGNIDVLDFGIYSSQHGMDFGTGDTPCGMPPPHADIDGDGVVSPYDYDILDAHFMMMSEDNCCGLPGRK